MTNFERTYLMTRQPKIAITYANDADNNKQDSGFAKAYHKFKEETLMRLEYRELDRLAMELEKEIKAVKALRIEMEKYKADVNIQVEAEATKKIEEVLDNMFK